MGAIKTKGNKSLPPPPSSRMPGTKARSNVAKRKAPGSKAAKSAATHFKAIGDPIRLSLLLTLAQGERGVVDLRTQIGEGQLAISGSLDLLQESGLVEFRRVDNRNLYSLTDPGRLLARRICTAFPSVRTGRTRPMKAEPIDSALLDDVSGFVDDAEGWFHSPNAAFEGRKPVELLGTPEESRLRSRIMAAKLGMFA